MSLQAEAAPSTPPQARTVVVIDDSDTVRRAIAAALAGAGYRVLEAATGEAGLKLVLTSAPDALVTDYELPGINGMAVIHRVRSHPSVQHLPCILLTGADAAPAEARGLEGGADAYIRKGTPLEEIEARLGALLRGATRQLVSLADAPNVRTRRILVELPSYPSDELLRVLEALRDQGYELVHADDQDPDGSDTTAIECVLLDETHASSASIRDRKAPDAPQHGPVIVLASQDDPRAMMDALQAGADDWVALSAGAEVVSGRVRAHLRRRHAEEQQTRLREEALLRELADAEARAARNLAETRAQLLSEVERKNGELEDANANLARTLREVKVREDQFRTVARCVPGVVYLLRHDRARTPIFLSVAVEVMTGYRAPDFVEKRVSWSGLIHDDDRDRVFARIDSAIGQRKPFETTYRIRHANAEWRWVEERGRAIFDEDEVRCLGGTIFDVTDRLKAEEELDRFRERQRPTGARS